MKWTASVASFVVVALTLSQSAAVQKKERVAFTDPAKAGPDFTAQGEYQGNGPDNVKLGAQVIAEGDGGFVAWLYAGGLPGDGWDGKTRLKASGKSVDGRPSVSGSDWGGEIADSKMVCKNAKGDKFVLEKIHRKSPTLGEKPPEGAVVLFDGSNADEWENGKLVEGNLLDNGVTSKRKFKDFRLHLEFRTPFMPLERGQQRGNSGVYLQDRYECQILDSFGLKGEDNECGGFYKQRAPAVNMCFPPLSWQTYDVEFQAARYDESGKKIANAVVTVKHNGVVIHDKVELKSETPGRQKEAPTPQGIHLQNHGDPVHFRNIWIVETR
jgi:hypothetical protein